MRDVLSIATRKGKMKRRVSLELARVYFVIALWLIASEHHQIPELEARLSGSEISQDEECLATRSFV